MKSKDLFLVLLFIGSINNSCCFVPNIIPIKTFATTNKYLTLNCLDSYKYNYKFNKYKTKKDLIIKTSNFNLFVYFIDGINIGIFINFINGLYDINKLPLFIIITVIFKVVLFKYIDNWKKNDT